jgi:hypothetical protein
MSNKNMPALAFIPAMGKKVKAGIFICSLFLIQSYASADFTFEGNLDVSKKQLQMSVQVPQESGEHVHDGSIEIHAEKQEHDLYHLSFEIGHLAMPSFFFSGNIQTSFQLLNRQGRLNLIDGKIWSEDPFINFEPLNRLSGQFEVKNEKLYLSSLSLGDILAKGSMELTSPYKMDFDVKLSSLNIHDFLSMWMREKEKKAEGEVSGQIKLTGAPNQIALKGKLESFNGFVEQLKYDSIHLNVEGMYPFLEVKNSTISKSDGLSYAMKGNFHLNDEQQSLLAQFKGLSFSPVVKKTDSTKEWTIKRVEDGNVRTEIKYWLRQDENDTNSTSTDSDLLGVERSVKF